MIPQLCSPAQIKAEDGGDPPLWTTVKLHVEWIRKPVPSPLPLLFTQRSYNFSVPETAAVATPVGVVAITQSTAPVWFNIIGESICAHTCQRTYTCNHGAGCDFVFKGEHLELTAAENYQTASNLQQLRCDINP